MRLSQENILANVRLEAQEAQDLESIQRLRDLGYSITTFTPDELGETDSGILEDLMIERGWDFIEHCNGDLESM
jgi:hypothetical protein